MKVTNVRRLEKLETRRHVGATCPECGHDPAAPFMFTLDTDSTRAEGRGPAEFCPRCGRCTWFTIVFDRRGP